jgi:adenosylhomocysteine nucleosidase
MTSDGGVTVVMLAALGLEYDALRALLTDLHVRSHPAGTLFEVGHLPRCQASAVIAVTDRGNSSAATLVERAIGMFRPQAVLFVGVAGALKDTIALGDVVVATKVYDYQGGKDTEEGFLARPRAWDAPHDLVQLARHVVRTGSWVAPAGGTGQPAVHFEPVAAGEVILDSRETPLAERLRRTYNDAAAVDMESAGMSQAGHLNRRLPALTIRGISDMADGGKSVADANGWQHTAAANCAAFAVALVTEYAARPGAAAGVKLDRLRQPLPTPGTAAVLLRADLEAVRFRGRDEELSTLRAWCGLTTLHRRSALLLTAGAGQGKSRLVRELGRRAHRP